jgi:hypothetical protein
MNPRWLAILLIVIYISLATSYGFIGDWRRALYWAAAAVICFVVTF